MDQSKVNPFVGNTETSAGGSPVSAPSNPVGAPAQSVPSAPVNPYAPAGAPYAPGSNTPAPDYATTSYATSSDGPAVPNTGSSAYTNFSPAPSQNYASPEKPKFFTKKFIIFAVIGLVLIASAVVAGVIIQNNKKTKSASNKITTTLDRSSSIKNEDNSIKTVFYQYANWILNGATDSVNPIKGSEADRSTTYYIRKAFLENDIDPADYMAKAKDYSNQLVQAVKSSANNGLKTIVDNNDGEISFLYEYSKTSTPSVNEILDIYNNVGKEGTEAELKNRYSAFSQMENYDANQYATLMAEYTNLATQYLEELKANGCLFGNTINDACRASYLSQSEQARKLMATILDKYSEIDSVAINAINTAINNCWIIEQGNNVVGESDAQTKN